MAVTLHSLLQEALDSETRNPVVTGASDSGDSEIPFNGQRLHNAPESERNPCGIVHSSGRYFVVYSRASDARGDLYMEYTDTSRTTWLGTTNAVLINTGSADGEDRLYPSIVELGNTAKDIGIVYIAKSATGVQSLKFVVVDITGAQVTAPTTIQAGSASISWYEPGVVRWSDDNTYTMICPRYNGTTWDLYRFTHAAVSGGSSWSSWTTVGAMTLTGGVANEKRNPQPKELTVAGAPQHWLVFDHVDATSTTAVRRNCYFAKNASKLSGSLACTRFTTSTANFGTSYVKPTVAQPLSYAANTASFAYTKTNSSILLNTSSTPSIFENSAYMIYYDSSFDYIIMIDRGSAGVSSNENGLLVIKASDFSVVQHYWRTNYTTGSNPILGNSSSVISSHYSYPCVTMAWNETLPWDYPSRTQVKSTIDIVNIQTQTIISIYEYSVTEDLVPEGSFRLSVDLGTITSISVEGTKIYVLGENITTRKPQIWSIDYSSATGVKTIEPVLIGYAYYRTINTGTLKQSFGGCHWDLPNKVLYFTMYHDYGSYPNPPSGGWQDKYYGGINKIDLNTGALLDEWTRTTTTNFPRSGAVRSCKVGDRLYFTAAENIETEGDLRGVGWVPDVDTAHNAPTMYSTDPFDARESPYADPTSGQGKIEWKNMKPTGDGRMMIPSRTNGLIIWDGASTPVVYNNQNVVGMPTASGNPAPITDVAYDGNRKRFYCANYAYDSPFTSGGIFIFDIDGDILQPYYSTFTGLNTTIVHPAAGGSQSILVTTNEDEHVHLLENGLDSGLAAFWSRRASGVEPTTLYPTGIPEHDLMFDEDLGSFDLTPYLKNVQVTQSIEHQPNRVEFSVARGELFDPLNARSTLRGILDQGRRVHFQKGEICSDGVTRVVDLFTGFIESGSMEYENPNHPIRTVVAYDITKTAYDFEVRVSRGYGYGGGEPIGRPDGDGDVTLPDNTAGIISHMAQTLAGIPVDDIAIGTFGNSASVQLQLVNMSPADMMEVVANRFQRIIYINNSGTLVTKTIEENPTVSNQLDRISSTNRLVRMNPDEGEGESTNRVTVRGVSDDELTVTYPYEFFIMANFVTTVGAGSYGGSKFFPYSDDYSVQAVNPSARDEFDSLQDVIMSPPVEWRPRVRLGDPITGEIVRYLGYSNFAPAVEYGFVTDDQIASFLQTRGALVAVEGPGYLESSFTCTVIMPIYAQRIGSIRQEIQASADDPIAQRRLRGNVIEKVIDFPAADTTSICQTMADWFMLRVKLARRIVGYTTLGHLRHEPGDVIEAIHPYSGEPMKAIIFQIVRSFERGQTDIQQMTLGVYE